MGRKETDFFFGKYDKKILLVLTHLVKLEFKLNSVPEVYTQI
jgi:hypothetical protein